MYLDEAEVIEPPDESPYLLEAVPPHVVGPTHGPRDTPVLLLDTELGVVCTGSSALARSGRADAAAWAIVDFFKILNDQYSDLHFIPVNSRTVVDVYATLSHGNDGMIETFQKIYREHGWPDLERYRKRECMEAIRIAPAENCPDY
ncbi:hypothetical protein ACJ72_03544 [Emergomyces africanus]|uniref:Uncharacterized protein n=1 Tax=Emergomyces africanus TaxID=1955775 RepID=A0A1B7NZA8_9EURO|nr:hypothetical protein ACJ72_03544 [Emergomyces africanus]